MGIPEIAPTYCVEHERKNEDEIDSLDTERLLWAEQHEYSLIERHPDGTLVFYACGD